jgi:hypothetical protein
MASVFIYFTKGQEIAQTRDKTRRPNSAHIDKNIKHEQDSFTRFSALLSDNDRLVC